MGGLSAVSGTWAGALKMRLGTGGLTCAAVQERDLRRNMLEKLVWTCAFNLIGAVHGGITVGEVESKHREEVEDLIVELASFCRFTLTVSLKTGLEDPSVPIAEPSSSCRRRSESLSGRM